MLFAGTEQMPPCLPEVVIAADHLARAWMLEAEHGRVQGDPRQTASIRLYRSAVKSAVVDAFATERRSSLTQVNADLMSSASLQPTLDERIFPEHFQSPNMSDRVLAAASVSGAGPPAAVAAVPDRPGLRCGGLGPFPAPHRQRRWTV